MSDNETMMFKVENEKRMRQENYFYQFIRL